MKLDDAQRAALKAARAVISPARAGDIVRLHNWKNGGCLGGTPRPDIAVVTDAEDQAIRHVWNALPGHTSWMTALYLIRGAR